MKENDNRPYHSVEEKISLGFLKMAFRCAENRVARGCLCSSLQACRGITSSKQSETLLGASGHTELEGQWEIWSRSSDQICAIKECFVPEVRPGHKASLPGARHPPCHFRPLQGCCSSVPAQLGGKRAGARALWRHLGPGVRWGGRPAWGLLQVRPGSQSCRGNRSQRSLR